jgi:TolA-binding protein
MNWQRTFSKVFVVGMLAGSVGCATTIPIETLQPGAVSVGAAKSLVILQGEGRRSGREAVFQLLIEKARQGSYFSVTDRSEEGVKVTIAGRKVKVDGDQKGMQPGELYFRVDVLGWDANKDSKTTTDSKGKETSTVTLNGKVLLGVTLFNAEGITLLAEKEYIGKSSSKADDASEEAVTKAAAADAVDRLLADITPKPVTRKVRLDDDEKELQPAIDTAKAGNLAKAAEDCKAYLEAHPKSSAAAYNLAVLTDAMGKYDEALALYDQALSIGKKDFYSEGRAACAKRKADAEALSK